MLNQIDLSRVDLNLLVLFEAGIRSGELPADLDQEGAATLFVGIVLGGFGLILAGFGGLRLYRHLRSQSPKA